MSGCIGSGDLSSISFSGKPGETFPRMTGINLHGEDVKIPDELDGQYRLLAVAFEREQQQEVNTWIDVADRLMQEYGGLRFYEIPLIYEMSAAGRWWVNNGMRSGIEDPKARTRTITVYTEREKFLESMDMEAGSIYVLLIDNKDNILWRHKGPVTEKARSDLENYLQENIQE